MSHQRLPSYLCRNNIDIAGTRRSSSAALLRRLTCPACCRLTPLSPSRCSLCATAREKPKTWLDEGPVEYLLPRHRMPLYESAFFSRHKTLPLVPHVNLLSPGALDEVFRTRSFKGEIIVSCFRNDDFSLRWMHHFARMAQSLGFDHVVPIGYDGATCEAFRRSWCGGVGCNDIEGAGYPGCAFLDPGAVEGADPRWQDAKRVDGIVYLWMVRYYVAAEALRRGINVLMSDTDVAVTSGAQRMRTSAVLRP